MVEGSVEVLGSDREYSDIESPPTSPRNITLVGNPRGRRPINISDMNVQDIYPIISRRVGPMESPHRSKLRAVNRSFAAASKPSRGIGKYNKNFMTDMLWSVDGEGLSKLAQTHPKFTQLIGRDESSKFGKNSFGIGKKEGGKKVGRWDYYQWGTRRGKPIRVILAFGNYKNGKKDGWWYELEDDEAGQRFISTFAHYKNGKIYRDAGLPSRVMKYEGDNYVFEYYNNGVRTLIMDSDLAPIDHFESAYDKIWVLSTIRTPWIITTPPSLPHPPLDMN